MRFGIPALAVLAFGFAAMGIASEAQAKSCSSMAIIKKYDAAKSVVEVKYEKGRIQKFFPRPEGTPNDTTKVPGSCARKITKHTELQVTATGGRMTVTQVRSNFEGKMLNDTNDETWLGKELEKLISAKTEVVIVVRPGMGKDAPLGITTLYLPITEEEKAEIKRLEAQAEEMD